MEQNLPIMAKKVWSYVRVMFFMLKKGIISKRKFFVDLNMMMKRGKIAGNNKQHHLAGEYEFSCRSTPPYPLSLFSTHNKLKNKRRHFATPAPPLAVEESCDDIIIDDAVFKVLNMLPEFRNTDQVVEQMRITESPFPLSNCGEDGHVDEAADRFINRFYNGLKREN